MSQYNTRSSNNSSQNIYYCFVKFNSVDRPVWSSDVSSSFKTSSGQTHGQIRSKPSNGIISERSFSFQWNSSMVTWNAEFQYSNKLGLQTFKCEIPIATILQDLKGGQCRTIPLNDDLGVMEIKFSDKAYIPPTAVAFCNPEQISMANMFYKTTQSTDKVQEGSIIANNMKNAKKLKIIVDLTGSNGDVKSGLHNIDQEKNSYRKAIMKFSDLISYLSPDTSMPVYGFGYRTGSKNKRKYNSISSNEYCTNFTNVYWPVSGPVGCGASIQCYDTMFEQIKDGEIELAGGTEFDTVMRTIESSFQRGDHTVILFFTDGQADDQQAFLDRCNRLTRDTTKFVSIILIVVGTGRDSYGNPYKQKDNILVFGQKDLDDGGLYKIAMDWIDRRSALCATY